MSATQADANLYGLQKKKKKKKREYTDPSYSADKVDSFVQLMM